MLARQRKKKSHHKLRNRSESLTSSDASGESHIIEHGSTYDIKLSKRMGRYMVSKKEIEPGEIVLSEVPIVVGPCVDCKVQCLGCYKNLEMEKKIKRCSNCDWPLCSRKCPGLRKPYGHTDLECTVLKETKSHKLLDYNDYTNLSANLQAIVPLRCLLLKTSDPTTYSAILNMEHHNAIRKNIPEVWNSNQVNVVDRVVKDWNMTEFLDEEIHTICGVLEVNCFEIGQQGINIRGLYPTAFLMSHDCVPNTNHIDDENDYRLTVRASTAIPAGYPITMSYAYTLQDTLKRRSHLLNNKFFECHCRRCMDPKELGSYTSALICPKCQTGLVLSNDPLDFESSWSCKRSNGDCPGYTITAKSVKLLIDRISQESDDIDCNDVTAMENFLDKYRNVLHPTHYLNLGIKVSLSQLYGKIDGYLIYELGEDMLERKIEICEELLKVLDIIEPGYSRIRGVTLYEIHAPMMILLSRRVADQSLTVAEIKSRLRKIVRYLLEASHILGYEPKSSPEGQMGVAAGDALLQIKNWEKIVGKM